MLTTLNHNNISMHLAKETFLKFCTHFEDIPFSELHKDLKVIHAITTIIHDKKSYMNRALQLALEVSSSKRDILSHFEKYFSISNIIDPFDDRSNLDQSTLFTILQTGVLKERHFNWDLTVNQTLPSNVKLTELFPKVQNILEGNITLTIKNLIIGLIFSLGMTNIYNDEFTECGWRRPLINVGKEYSGSPNTTKLLETPKTSSIVRNSTTTVNTTNVQTTTHEHAEKNPIFTESGIQHPSYTRNICETDACRDKLCINPCSDIIEKEFIGHATHNGTFPEACFLSMADLTGDPDRPQYGVFYDIPVLNTDILDVTKDINKTEQLNKDITHLTNVYMNSSKEKTLNNITKIENDITPENIN